MFLLENSIHNERTDQKGNIVKLDASMVLVPYPRSKLKKIFMYIRSISIIQIFF